MPGPVGFGHAILKGACVFVIGRHHRKFWLLVVEPRLQVDLRPGLGFQPSIRARSGSQDRSREGSREQRWDSQSDAWDQAKSLRKFRNKD